jgi:hypothetical protein
MNKKEKEVLAALHYLLLEGFVYLGFKDGEPCLYEVK